tara:strand:- start:464 stop:1528 length:1065 start_codon:yes stop_codon:yes gene_type:complete
MSYKQMTGNIISATKVEPSGSFQDDAASGVWNLQDQYDYVRGGNWPTSGNAQRGFFARSEPASGSKTIKSINLTTTGNDGSDFGDLHTASRNGGAGQCSSSTRAIVFMGIDSNGTRINNIQYYNMVTAGDGADFGDATTAAYQPGTLSNGTRAIRCGGTDSANNIIEYVTIDTTGNATDFGDFDENSYGQVGLASTTRGLFCGGYDSNQRRDEIKYITIASTGDVTDFGDLLATGSFSEAANLSCNALASSTRGVIAGGNLERSGTINVIQYVTIASTGNASDFGDLTEKKQSPAGASSKTLGYFAAGSSAPSGDNTRIEHIVIASTGNASDFGDIGLLGDLGGTASVSHGGLA